MSRNLATAVKCVGILVIASLAVSTLFLFSDPSRTTAAAVAQSPTPTETLKDTGTGMRDLENDRSTVITQQSQIRSEFHRLEQRMVSGE